MSKINFIESKLGLSFRLGHIPLGKNEANCYVIPLKRDIVVVDPGVYSEVLENWIAENLKGTLHIYLTHGHYDHIGGVNSLLNRFSNSKVYIHKDDYEFLYDTKLNLTDFVGDKIIIEKLERVVKLEGDQELVFEDMKFKVLSLPGHTPGSSGLYSSAHNLIFQGDTLFRNNIGRFDFPRGCFNDLVISIKNVLFKLPASTIVFTGHGNETTIGDELSD